MALRYNKGGTENFADSLVWWRRRGTRSCMWRMAQHKAWLFVLTVEFKFEINCTVCIGNQKTPNRQAYTVQEWLWYYVCVTTIDIWQDRQDWKSLISSNATFCTTFCLLCASATWSNHHVDIHLLSIRFVAKKKLMMSVFFTSLVSVIAEVLELQGFRTSKLLYSQLFDGLQLGLYYY